MATELRTLAIQCLQPSRDGCEIASVLRLLTIPIERTRLGPTIPLNPVTPRCPSV